MGTICISTMMSGVKARPASPSSTGKNFAAICIVTSADSLIRTKYCNLHSRWERDEHIWVLAHTRYFGCRMNLYSYQKFQLLVSLHDILSECLLHIGLMLEREKI